ncbi:hypothetical protein NKG05_10240 [Oerskovia sp. M15]
MSTDVVPVFNEVIHSPVRLRICGRSGGERSSSSRCSATLSA